MQGSEALKTLRPFSNTYNLGHGEIAKGGHLFDIDLSQNPSLLTEDPEGLPVGHLAGDSTSEAFFSSKSSDGEGQINRVNNKRQFFRGESANTLALFLYESELERIYCNNQIIHLIYQSIKKFIFGILSHLLPGSKPSRKLSTSTQAHSHHYFLGSQVIL